MSNGRWTEKRLADHLSVHPRALRSNPLVRSLVDYGVEKGLIEKERSALASFVVPGEPIPKPRQTRSDKWKERPCVIRYRDWADKARSEAGAIPAAAQHADIVAYLPLPKSLSLKKRQELAGTPHRVKPDLDNIVKSCLDALLSRDQGIHEIRAKKRWEDANGPRVEITIY